MSTILWLIVLAPLWIPLVAFVGLACWTYSLFLWHEWKWSRRYRK